MRIAGIMRIAPEADLADLIEQHWVVAWDHRGRQPVVQEVLPDPCVNLTFEPDGVLLHGVKHRRSSHELPGAGIVVGTKFRPGGFSGFVPGPVQALADRAQRVADMFGAEGAALERALTEAASTQERIALLTEFVRARRPPPNAQRELAASVVEAMREAPSETRVADLAARFAVTPRSLQRLFAVHVGTSPKRVLQRFRHQKATDRLDGAENVGHLAAELGYFDQAHFTQDFRAATGRLPSALAR